MSDAEFNSGACTDLVNQVSILAASNSAFREHAAAVLAQDNFQLVCANKKFFQENEINAISFFQAGSNAIVMAHDNFQAVDLSHEMIHAYQHYLHLSDGNCFIPYTRKSQDTISPIFPINPANIKQFETYMDAGDRRIKNLFTLSQKEINDEPLTADEKYQLLRAKAELDDTTPDHGITKFQLQYLADFKKLGWPDKKELHVVINKYDVVIKKVTVNKDHIQVRYQIVGAIDSIYNTISHFEKLKSEGNFASKNIEISERLAYSHQCLSRKGRGFLYPELTQYLAEQKKLCQPEKKASLGKTEL